MCAEHLMGKTRHSNWCLEATQCFKSQRCKIFFEPEVNILEHLVVYRCRYFIHSVYWYFLYFRLTLLSQKTWLEFFRWTASRPQDRATCLDHETNLGNFAALLWHISILSIQQYLLEVKYHIIFITIFSHSSFIMPSSVNRITTSTLIFFKNTSSPAMFSYQLLSLSLFHDNHC